MLWTSRPRRVIGLSVAWAGLCTTLLTAHAAPTNYDWPQFNGNDQHTGNNIHEALITPANVAQLTQQIHVRLPDVADGAPVYLSDITIGGQAHNVLFMTTRDAHILGVDAFTGATLWS